MNQYGFVRITCVSPRTAVANPSANAAEIVRVLEPVPDSDVVRLPGAVRHRLHLRRPVRPDALLDAGVAAVGRIAEATAGRGQLVVVGVPIPVGNSLFNCAVAIGDGSVLGVVPKQFLPNYKEFYESRWFSPAVGKEPAEIELGGRTRAVRDRSAVRGPGAGGEGGPGGVVVGIEICEDLWVPVPPSALQAMAGATVLLNLSASNETIGKSRYRTDLVVGQSGRCDRRLCDGRLRAVRVDDRRGLRRPLPDRRERPACSPSRPGSATASRSAATRTAITRDVDVARLRTDRRVMTSFDDSLSFAAAVPPRGLRAVAETMEGLKREVPGTPFVPSEGPSCTAAAPRSSASSARGWPSGSSSSRPARR